VLNLIGAIVILIVGWLIATIVAGVVKNLLKRTDLDNRLVRSVMSSGQALNLNVQNLLNDILAALPRILEAVMIGVVGWVVARVVRGIITNLLTATGADPIGVQFGLRRTAGSQSLSWLLGTIVYVLILIPTAIAVLLVLAFGVWVVRHWNKRKKSL
jgi:small-conductance mechanosensitive channel